MVGGTYTYFYRFSSQSRTQRGIAGEIMARCAISFIRLKEGKIGSCKFFLPSLKFHNVSKDFMSSKIKHRISLPHEFYKVVFVKMHEGTSINNVRSFWAIFNLPTYKYLVLPHCLGKFYYVQ